MTVNKQREYQPEPKQYGAKVHEGKTYQIGDRYIVLGARSKVVITGFFGRQVRVWSFDLESEDLVNFSRLLEE